MEGVRPGQEGILRTEGARRFICLLKKEKRSVQPRFPGEKKETLETEM
jgi:hypothetical protein